jgi:hypothetical protein
MKRSLRSAPSSAEETDAPRRESSLPIGWMTVTKKHGFAGMAQNTAKSRRRKIISFLRAE